MKKNKGFTLIELLITIVMLLSLTILVVVSFVEISDRKKEEAKELTDKQIENAAEQFFSSEYYWINYLKLDPSAEVYVNVAKLVEKDYLNVMSKTTTEKKYNRCDIVKVTYESGKIKYKYEEADDSVKDCEPVLKLSSNLDIEIKPVSYEKGNISDSIQWYIEKDIVLNIKVSSKIKDAVNKISDVKFQYQDKETEAKLLSANDYERIYEFTFNKNNLNTLVVTASNFSKVSYSEISLYLDKEKPADETKAFTYKNDFKGYKEFSYFDSKYYLETDSWINKSSEKKNIYFSANLSDSVSGINAKKSSCKIKESKESFNTNKGSDKYSIYKSFINDGVYDITCNYEDLAGNKNSVNYIVKKDTTVPTCSLKVVGNVKTVNKDKDGYFVLKNYNFDITTDKKTNYKGWYSDKNIVVSFKTKTDSLSDIVSYGLTTNSKTYNFKSSDIHSSETNGTKWYGYVKDNAGNENSCDITLKNDYTAPTISKTGAGSVMCLNSDGTEYNAFGYSIKFKDNLSGATARLSRYISHWKCTDGKFDWADSSAQNSSSGSNDKVYTVFAGCANNPTPEAKFILIDQAGNAYNSGKEVHLKITKSSQAKTKKKCDNTKWFDEYPNRIK